jgi:hypothetical protein
VSGALLWQQPRKDKYLNQLQAADLPVDILAAAAVSEVVLEAEATDLQEILSNLLEVAASSSSLVKAGRALQDVLYVHCKSQGGLIHHAGDEDCFRHDTFAY